MKNLLNLIKESVYISGKPSSTRIISYLISIIIFIFSMTFIYLEINGITISNEIIIVFGALLTHQLSLLGITKYNERKNKIIK